jgi:hypothetical protein
MQALRIDFHAHLYDVYPVRTWCLAAIANLQLRSDIGGVLVVVDREGQDSFARLKREVVQFGSFMERPTAQGNAEQALLAEVVVEGKTLFILRGVQYVSAEKLEVLGLGVARSVPDGLSCFEILQLITEQDGIPCLPWSPGKWLGALAEYGGSSLTFGDIAIRSRIGPPSLLLSRARRSGFPVLCGTDPLPRKQDSELVGSYGAEIRLVGPAGVQSFVSAPKAFLVNQINKIRPWGGPNGPFTSLQRFISSL